MRFLSTNNASNVTATILRPVWLVDIGFTTPLYFSSRGAITYEGRSYVAAGIKVEGDNIVLFNDSLQYSDEFIAGDIGARLRVYELFGEGPFADGDATLAFDGEVGQIIVGVTIQITMRATPPRTVPRVFAFAPTFNHIPPDGTEILTPAGTFILEGNNA